MNREPGDFVDDRLALKGGTATNLFIRDMPGYRLSTPIEALAGIHAHALS